MLEGMKLEEMKKLLQNIRTYADMTGKLGLRGRKLFSHGLSGEQSLNVEYFPALGENSAWQQAQTVFKRSFKLTPKREDVVFIPSENVKWGMKVYVDDNMVDLSFKKVEDLLQK